MLNLSRAQLEDEARTVDTRLAAVETRLQMIEKENTMSADFVVKTLPAVRLVARTATLDPDRLGEHIGPMFDAVATALDHACGALSTPIAGDQVLDDQHGHPAPGEVGRVVDPDGVRSVGGPVRERATLALGGARERPEVLVLQRQHPTHRGRGRPEPADVGAPVR